MNEKDRNGGEDGSVLRRNSRRMRMTAMIMFAVALLAITAVSITDSDESDAADGGALVSFNPALVTINVSAWDSGTDLVFTATYAGAETYVGIVSATISDGTTTKNVSRTSTNALGPANFEFTVADFTDASFPSGQLTITFVCTVYDEISIIGDVSKFTVSGISTYIIKDSGNYYLERGEAGSIEFTLTSPAPLTGEYYRGAAAVTGGVSESDIRGYSTIFLVSLEDSAPSYEIELSEIEMYAVTVGDLNPTEYTVTFTEATTGAIGDGFRNVSDNVGFVDVTYTGTFTVDTEMSDPYYRLLNITYVDTPYVPIAFDITETCDVTPTDSSTVVEITVTEVYIVTVGTLNPTEYTVTFTLAADGAVNDGFRNVTDNVGFVDAGYTGTFTVGTAFGDPYYRITGITDIDTPYVPGIFDTSVTCTVETPTDSSKVVAITVTEMYMVTVGAVAPTDYTVTFAPAANGLAGNGFRNVNGNIGYVDATFTGTFTVNTLFTDPYYRLVGITNIDAPYTPGIMDVTATGAVTPTDSTIVVGITSVELCEMVFSYTAGVNYTVYPATTHNTAADGFRQPTPSTADVYYIDAGKIGIFDVESDFNSTDGYYRLTEITNIDAPGFTPDILTTTAYCEITAIGHMPIEIITTQMYEVTFSTTTGAFYDPVIATTHTAAADGFRQPAISTPDVYYIDVTCSGYFDAYTMLSNPYYRLTKITNIDVAYYPDLLDADWWCYVTPAADVLIEIEAVQVYEVVVNCGIGGTYSVIDAVINDVAADGFRQPWWYTQDVYYIDAGYVGVSEIYADSGYRIKDVTAGTAAPEVHYGPTQRVYYLTYELEPLNDVILDIEFKKIWNVTLYWNPNEGGTAIGGGIYDDGTVIMITAAAADGYKFIGWEDGNKSVNRPVAVRSNIVHTATFEKQPVMVTIWVIAEEGGSVTGGGMFAEGSSVSISATAKSGYEFVKWNDGSTSANRTVTATAETTYIAEFSKNADDSSNDWSTILIIIIVIVAIIIIAAVLFYLIFGRKGA